MERSTDYSKNVRDAYTITSITFSEWETGAVLKFFTKGFLQCELSTEKKGETDWLLIRLNPVRNDVARLAPGIHSSLLGEMKIHQNAQEVELRIEALQSISYFLERRANAILVRMRLNR